MITQNERKKYITDYLKEMFPHGHEDFIPMSVSEMELHSTKNHDYAFGGDPLGNFLRGSQILAMYPKLDLSDPAVYAMVLMLKQLDAALWMKSQGHIAKVEGIIARMTDVSVYSKIVCILEKHQVIDHEEMSPYLRAKIDDDSMSE